MDSIFKQLSLKDRDTLQVRADAILAQIELIRTAVNLDFVDTAAISDRLDELRTAAIADRAAISLMVVDDAAIADRLDELRTAAIADRTRVDILNRRAMNHMLNPGLPGLIEGTNANTLKIAAAVDFINQGIQRTQKAITDNIVMDAAAEQAISTFCKYLVCLTSGGTVTITKGGEDSAEVSAFLPAVPANQTPIGYFQIATDGATTFTSGTTDLGAAGITDTYVGLFWPNSGVDDLIAAVGAHGIGAALGAIETADPGAHGIGAALGAIETAALSATGLSALGTLPH